MTSKKYLKAKLVELEFELQGLLSVGLDNPGTIDAVAQDVNNLIDDIKSVKEKLQSKSESIKLKDIYEEVISDQKKTGSFNLDTYIDNLNTEDPKLKEFIRKRIIDFIFLKEKLKKVESLLELAKQDTIDKYQAVPNFNIIYGTDLVDSYLDDVLTLLRK